MPTSKQIAAAQEAYRHFNWVEHQRCPCGSLVCVSIIQHDRYGLNIPCVICKRCGIIRFTKTLHKEDIEEYYDQYYRRMINKQHTSGVQERVQFLLDNTPNPIVRLLDIGAGTGDNAKLLEKRLDNKVNLVAVEQSEEMRDILVERGFSVKTSIDEVSGKFDLIILAHVIEHAIDPIQLLSKCQELLSDTGSLYIETFSIYSINKYGYNLREFLPHFHVHTFAPINLSNIAYHAELCPVKVTKYIRSLWCKGKPTKPSLHHLRGEFEEVYRRVQSHRGLALR